MSDWEMKIITAEARRLLTLAAEDAALRAELRALAEEVLAATGPPRAGLDAGMEPLPSWDIPTSPSEEGSSPGPTTPEVARADPVLAPEPLRELTLGRSPPARSEIRPAATVGASGSSDDDLPEIEARCRRKAEAARWAAERQRRAREGTDFPVEETPMDREVAEWADRLSDRCHGIDAPGAAQPPDVSRLDQAGGCYEAVAEALALVSGTLDDRRGHPKALERGLSLVAEAQSALRTALQLLHAPEDPDQLRVFEWLKATAAWHHVFIKRFMRADDPADPARWGDLLSRVEREQSRQGRAGRPSRSSSAIERLRALLDALRKGEDAGEGWRAVIEAVDEIVEQGTPPSNREIRDLLLPVLDEIPEREDLPNGFRLVLREIDRFLATRPGLSSATVAPEPGAEVKAAARLLGGKAVVLIGGSRRREAQESLKRALGLKELIWVETKEHQSVGSFEPAIARPDVALILLAIRWSSHAFGDVRQYCDRLGKPLVRLPGGYSPNQVAAQILSQTSGQFGDG